MWIENSPYFVNQPGDWALDSSKGLLYYIPRPTEDLNSAEVLIPQITTLIEANGITNIAFVGIEFRAGPGCLNSFSASIAGLIQLQQLFN
jgi:hypothetical protein